MMSDMTFVLALALVLGPLAVLLLLRANSALVFAALCLGFTVTHFVSSSEISTQLAPYIGPAKDNQIQLLLAFLPAVVLLLATLRSQAKGIASKVLNGLPAVGVGFLTILLVLPFLPSDVRSEIVSLPFWDVVLTLQAPIIGISALASLVLLATSQRYTGGNSLLK